DGREHLRPVDATRLAGGVEGARLDEGLEDAPVDLLAVDAVAEVVDRLEGAALAPRREHRLDGGGADPLDCAEAAANDFAGDRPRDWTSGRLLGPLPLATRRWRLALGRPRSDGEVEVGLVHVGAFDREAHGPRLGGELDDVVDVVAVARQKTGHELVRVVV